MLSDKPQDFIPHREPFLWVHHLIEAGTDPDSGFYRGRVELRLDADLDVFEGHFPELPVFPGVLQLEAAAQACLWIRGYCLQKNGQDEWGLLSGFDKAKFRKKVLPPARLSFRCEESKRKSWLSSWQVSAYELSEDGSGEVCVSSALLWMAVKKRDEKE